jgi:hypothetical protein
LHFPLNSHTLRRVNPPKATDTAYAGAGVNIHLAARKPIAGFHGR